MRLSLVKVTKMAYSNYGGFFKVNENGRGIKKEA